MDDYSAMSNQLSIAGVQMDIQLGQFDSNLKHIQNHFITATNNGAQLVAFPECALTGYCFDSLEQALPFAKTLQDDCFITLQELCAQQNAHMIVGFLQKHEGLVYNSVALVGPDGVKACYQKTHLPFLGVDRFVEPGQSLPVIDLNGIQLGLLICYDGSFPEAARSLALKGADLIVLSTNWPSQSIHLANHVTSTRAFENTVYMMSVNRVGVEQGFEFCGHSQICQPSGAPLDQALHANEAILYATIDAKHSRTKSIIRVPGEYELNNIQGRRTDLYELG